MKNNLYIYACSYGKFGTSTGTNANHWIDENSFGDVLSNKLNINLINRSWAGASNFHIFRKVMQDVNHITENDLVIIQYSFINRAYCIDHNKTVMPQYLEFEEYYQTFYSDQQSLSMLVSFNEYLKKKIPCKFVYSSVDDLQNLKAINSVLYEDFINDERFFSINDYSPIVYLHSRNDNSLFFPCGHLSVNGHIRLAELYHNFIINMERSSIG